MSAHRASAVCAAIMCLAVPQAEAADLYGENPYPPRYEEPYPPDDQAPYAGQAYRDEAPRAYDRYGEDDDDAGRYPPPPPERGPIYGDRGSLKDGYAAPPPPPPRYSERFDDPRGGCLPRWQLKRVLRSDGWRELVPLETAGQVATIRARRQDSGRMFTLKVDSCSGEIVHARPYYLSAYGAYDARPWQQRRWRY